MELCQKCERLVNGKCTAYSPEGVVYRNRMGYCPVGDIYAEWRTDKPKEVVQKIRIGQQKRKR